MWRVVVEEMDRVMVDQMTKGELLFVSSSPLICMAIYRLSLDGFREKIG